MEFSFPVILTGSGIIVSAVLAFARIEGKVRMVQRDVKGKAEKDVVEVKLDSLNDKIDAANHHLEKLYTHFLGE